MAVKLLNYLELRRECQGHRLPGALDSACSRAADDAGDCESYVEVNGDDSNSLSRH